MLTSHSHPQKSRMEIFIPVSFPKIGNGIYIPVPVHKSWECYLSFPFPKVGNGLSHSRSCSRKSKSHSLSPLYRTMDGSLKIYTCTVFSSSTNISFIEKLRVDKSEWRLVEHRFMMFFSQNCCNIISSQVCWRTSDTFGFHSTLHLDWSHELEYP